MNAFLSILQVVQLLAAIGMIGLILMQHGKGADAGAAFGGGAGSASLFGATGGANFLSRTTAVLATVFLVATLALAYLGNQSAPAASTGSVLEGAAPSAPAETAQPAETGAVTAPAAVTDEPAAQKESTEAPSGAAQIPGQ
ncbi:preprotein translocase subunit SecG [Hydrogenophaga sp. 5NK40-0174]|uniref:preprotein translocase subunit SecG n=1 Tax=Hydrogenophaga sp. 5NK40-0174 TaxID=3127649 RepID=UPI0031042DEC